VEALADQVAVVTGATSGIGKAIACGLVGQGAAVGLVGRDQDALEQTARSVRKPAMRVLQYQVDLTLDNEILTLTKRVQQDLGFVDILVHSAGVISLGSMEAASMEDLDWQYKINVRAAYFLTKNLMPMIRSGQGQIVFINSSVSLNARANVGQYAATKHALKAVADSLREEVNPRGLRVMSVFLGRTATPMQAGVHKMERKEYHPERLLQPEDVASVVVHALSLPRSAEVTDIHIRPLATP
jgi:NADP-dependent 3-hydroxy acid dehydrogenase YdfG